MLYQVSLAYLEGSEVVFQGVLVTSTPLDKEIDAWLRENSLGDLTCWKYAGLTGDSSVRDHEAMNTIHLDPIARNPQRGELLITVCELVPVEDVRTFFR
jgi:hypothetical protein